MWMLPTDPLHLPGDSLGGSTYVEPMKAMQAGVEVWTEAVVGNRIASRGKIYAIVNQVDAHSWGVCVSNAINAYMHGTELFHHDTRSMFRLQYFIMAAEYLLQDPVCPPPAGYSSICSPPPGQDRRGYGSLH